jgi:hypothetical protein
MSVSDRLGGLSMDGFAKLTNSQPIHHAGSTHLDHTTPMPRSQPSDFRAQTPRC